MCQCLFADTAVGIAELGDKTSELSVQDCIAAGQAIDVGDKTCRILFVVAGNFISQRTERSGLAVLNVPKKRVVFSVGLLPCPFFVTEHSFDTARFTAFLLDIFL